MLVTAAVLWAVVGAAYVAQAMGGDVLSGFAGLLVALAALVAAVTGLIAALNGRQAKNNSAEAKENSAEAVRSLGPSNGTTVLELLHEVRTFAAYQHKDNHATTTTLARIDGSTALLMKVIEQLLDKLKETES